MSLKSLGIASSLIAGTTTNNNAPAGFVGELITATVAVGAAITLTTATGANVTSISLTAGDWDVSGAIDFIFAATTNGGNLQAGISLTSATLASQAGGSGLGTDPTTLRFFFNFAPGTWTEVVTTPTVRVSIAATTTVFLVALANFTVAGLTAYGTIRARRVR